MVDWPETRSGSGPVVMDCPNNVSRTVTRECIDGIWTEADYNICLGQLYNLNCSCNVNLLSVSITSLAHLHSSA